MRSDTWITDNNVTAYLLVCVTSHNDMHKAFFLNDYKVIKRTDAAVWEDGTVVSKGGIKIDIADKGFCFFVYEVQSPKYPHPLLFLGGEESTRLFPGYELIVRTR